MIPYFKNIILLLIISVFSFSFNCYRVSGWLFFFLNFTSLNGNKPWTIFPFEHVLPRWQTSAQSTRLFCPSIFHSYFLYVPFLPPFFFSSSWKLKFAIEFTWFESPDRPQEWYNFWMTCQECQANCQQLWWSAVKAMLLLIQLILQLRWWATHGSFI